MKKTFLSLLMIITAFFVSAQDTHYWTNQFGTRSVVMGGAVVAGKPDNSMVYYNPGALAFLDSSSVSINATLYQAEDFNFKNTLGNQDKMNSLQLTAVPLLISGQFKIKNERFRMGYGIFSPVTFQFRGGSRNAAAFPIVADTESPGAEAFVGDHNIFSRLRELVLSLGIAYQFSEHWAIGFTNLIDIRTQIYNKASFARYSLNDAPRTLVSASLTESFNYYHARYMPKLGIAFRSSGWSFGATATAPGIKILGTGTLAVDALGTNIKLDAATRGNAVFNDRQTKLKSFYKSPFSASFGIQYQKNKTSIAFTTEYFGEMKQYDILRGSGAGFSSPSNFYNSLGGANAMRVHTAARPVWNFAIGLEQVLNEQMVFSAGFRNNKSYYDATLLDQPGVFADLTSWDIFHAVAGITRRRERSSISFGLTAGFGSDKNRMQERSVAQPQETILFQGTSVNTEGTYRGLGILLGYNYFFRKG